MSRRSYRAGAEMGTGEEEDDSHFGSLLSIRPYVLIALIAKIRNHSPSDGRLISRVSGSFNLVFVIQFCEDMRYVVRIPAVGWGDHFTETAKESFVSQALTMQWIWEKRGPSSPGGKPGFRLPQIYAFDASLSNEVGAPYMIMSYLPGETVLSVWADSAEHVRQKILASLAETMVQLDGLEFDQIGSLQFRNKKERTKYKIGPCSYCSEDDHLTIHQCGPFQTTKSYLLHLLDLQKQPRSPYSSGAQALLRLMIDQVTDISRESFVLGPPDFDSQNVMVDDEGAVTGIIDWDHVSAMPKPLGFLGYPGWITRDWDPLIFDPEEDSPERSEEYRNYYLHKIKELIGDHSAHITSTSHIFEALWIAARDQNHLVSIVEKLLLVIIPEEDALDIISDAAEGCLGTKMLSRILDGFIQLIGE